MKCKYCDYEISKGMSVCPQCGETISENLEFADKTNVTVEDEIKKKEKKKRGFAKFFNASLLGMVSSIIIAIMGIATMCGMFNYELTLPGELKRGATVTSRYYSYGGDAYTGIQNAAAEASTNAAAAAINVDISNNLIQLGLVYMYSFHQTVTKAVGLLITSIGILGFFYFSLKRKKKVSMNDETKDNMDKNSKDDKKSEDNAPIPESDSCSVVL